MASGNIWSSIVSEHSANLETKDMTIKLRKITSDDLEEQRNKYVQRRKMRKNAYFCKDPDISLTDDDMLYQILNPDDTTCKQPLLPERIEQEIKLRETRENFFESAERPLTSKLNFYYAKNLKSCENLNNEDFSYSFSEIQELVKRTRFSRKQRKLNKRWYLKECGLGGKNSTTVKNEFENFNNNLNVDEKNICVEKTVEPEDSKPSLLNCIDIDFKPSIIPSTRTYSRKSTIRII